MTSLVAEAGLSCGALRPRRRWRGDRRFCRSGLLNHPAGGASRCSSLPEDDGQHKPLALPARFRNAGLSRSLVAQAWRGGFLADSV
jgi:hypothetical protein